MSQSKDTATTSVLKNRRRGRQRKQQQVAGSNNEQKSPQLGSGSGSRQEKFDPDLNLDDGLPNLAAQDDAQNRHLD
jgi:hypothetical protein